MPQAASHGVIQLENELGVRLFHRTTRKLSLTEEGLRLYDNVKPALSIFSAALNEARLSREDVGGVLRVSAPRALGLPVLWPTLAEFQHRYPSIQLEVQFDDQFTDYGTIYLYYGHRTEMPLRVKTFIDFMVARLADNADFFLTSTELRVFAAPSSRA